MIGDYKNFQIEKTSAGTYVAKDQAGRVKFKAKTEEELIKSIDQVVRGPAKPVKPAKKPAKSASKALTQEPQEPVEEQIISRQATVTSSTVSKAPITSSIQRRSDGRFASKKDTQNETEPKKKSFWDRLG